MTERTTDTAEAGRDGARRLVVVRVGERSFGIYADAIERFGAINDDGGDARVPDAGSSLLFAASAPVPLPSAPAAVRGVVAVRGRVYTLIDLARVLDHQSGFAPGPADDSPGGDDALARSVRVLPLRGGEQLAIEAERVETTIRIGAAELTAPPEPSPAVAGVVRAGETREMNEDVLVLDTEKLFAAATRGMERRRRRT